MIWPTDLIRPGTGFSREGATKNVKQFPQWSSNDGGHRVTKHPQTGRDWKVQSSVEPAEPLQMNKNQYKT